MPGTHYPTEITRQTVRFLLQKNGLNVKHVRTTDMGYFLHDGSPVTSPTFTVSKVRERGVRKVLIVDVYGLPDVPGDGTVGDNERVIAATNAQHAEALQPVVDVLATYGIKATLGSRDVEVDCDQAALESEQDKVERQNFGALAVPDGIDALPDPVARELRTALGAMPYAASLNTKPETIAQMVGTLTGLARILTRVAEEHRQLEQAHDKLLQQRQAMRDFLGTGSADYGTETVTLAAPAQV